MPKAGFAHEREHRGDPAMDLRFGREAEFAEDGVDVLFHRRLREVQVSGDAGDAASLGHFL
jgi:hypothetical protein